MKLNSMQQMMQNYMQNVVQNRMQKREINKTQKWMKTMVKKSLQNLALN